MAVLSPEEYKSEYHRQSAELSDAKAEIDRLRRDFKRIDSAEEAAAEAAAAQANAEAKALALEAELAAARAGLKSAEENVRLLSDKAARFDAIKSAIG